MDYFSSGFITSEFVVAKSSAIIAVSKHQNSYLDQNLGFTAKLFSARVPTSGKDFQGISLTHLSFSVTGSVHFSSKNPS